MNLSHLGRRAVVSLTALVAFSCATGSDDTGEVTVHSEEKAVLSWKDYRASARVVEGLYIVEWDLVFSSEAQLRSHYEQVVVRAAEKLAVFQQLSTGFEPTYQGSDALSIVYCVSNAFSNKSTVVGDMDTATHDWQRVSNVRFSYASDQDSTCNQNNSNVDFAVMPVTSPAGLAGCASSKMFWSPSGDPNAFSCPIGDGTVLAKGVLSLQYGALPLFPGTTGAGLIRHELGHMLGFRHEHPWAPGQGGCVEAPTHSSVDLTGRRLTDYDQASVMHYAECDGIANADSIISALDGAGARSIYGMPAAWYVPILGS